MKKYRKYLLIIAAIAVTLLLALVITVRVRYGGGSYFPDRSKTPIMPASVLEVVANLDMPPGNIAVAANNRIFFSFHPDAHPEIKLAELINGQPVPYPDRDFQHQRAGQPYFDTVLGIRIDQQQRLWTIDHANHGSNQPRLLGFDLNTNKLVHQFDFPAEIAGLGSMLNDFQVDPTGSKIYIAEASVFKKTPAIIVYDIASRTARRLLENHPSVQAPEYIPRAPNRDMVILGIFTIRPGVDSIALDKRGEWLYYGAVTAENLYRVRTADLNDTSLSAATLATRVETFAPKTMSDGLSMDSADNIYLTDLEHSAIHSINPQRELQTLVKDAKLRWPDGLSFGPDNQLYISCSAIHEVIFQSAAHIRSQAPYQIYRFKPGPAGVPGQ